MSMPTPENIQSPEARKAYNLFRKEEKVRESTSAWTEYNGQKTRALQQLNRLRDERLARGPIVPKVPVVLVGKPRAKQKSKRITPPRKIALGRSS